MAKYTQEPAQWDDGEYNTRRTRPPKSHRGLIAVLLIAVILLIGLSSALGFSTLRLFHLLQQEQAAQTVGYTQQASAATDELVSTESMEIPHSVASTFPALAPAQEGLTLQEIYVRCIPSVVSITAQGYGSSSAGTGVIFSEDGYVVTNSHVVDQAQSYSALLYDGRSCPAVLVGSDPTSDLAVLLIDADDLTRAEFGDSDLLRVGDSVVAIGDPLGVEYRGTMTDGIVSAINRNVNVNGRTMNLIQTNAALNSGNSGGPLINSCGQVVGINTIKIAAFADDAGVEGLGFAIPSTIVKDIASQLISQGYVSGRPWLGIQGESLSLFYQRYYRLPAGLYIQEVEPGSTAAQAGITPGDVLISIDDNRIYSQNDLDTLLYRYCAGDTVAVSIYRSGRTLSANLTLGEVTQPGI